MTIDQLLDYHIPHEFSAKLAFMPMQYLTFCHLYIHSHHCCYLSCGFQTEIFSYLMQISDVFQLFSKLFSCHHHLHLIYFFFHVSQASEIPFPDPLFPHRALHAFISEIILRLHFQLNQEIFMFMIIKVEACLFKEIRELSSTSIKLFILERLLFGSREQDPYCEGHRGNLRFFFFKEVKILLHLSQKKVNQCFQVLN